MNCTCKTGSTKEIKVEGDMGADPIWCSRCGCNFDLEELPISDALKDELSSWSLKYGEWINWETEKFLPNGLELEEVFNECGILLTMQVIEELGDRYIVQYVASNYRVISERDTENEMVQLLDDYLPRHKHDIERVTKLNNLDKSELLPLLPALMEWMQDINWPIAREVAQLLLTCPEDIIHLIKIVLTTDDEPWKYWCLEYLVKEMPEELRAEFKEDLIRIAENPTVGEKDEDLDELAKEIVNTLE
ncbi:MAG: DUF5071 domain-containing protein [Cytobacillus gottheilii]|uniref:DUF5071 domain-containing protein n=1 Tax=Cytobacillus gottheilii TaxID=859144 RepID=UPI000A81AD5B|nr:DUF5071 domain-containing protein [Cytobacillus gottheilii]